MRKRLDFITADRRSGPGSFEGGAQVRSESVCARVQDKYRLVLKRHPHHDS
jgi:hypothetical protein